MCAVFLFCIWRNRMYDLEFRFLLRFFFFGCSCLNFCFHGRKIDEIKAIEKNFWKQNKIKSYNLSTPSPHISVTTHISKSSEKKNLSKIYFDIEEQSYYRIMIIIIWWWWLQMDNWFFWLFIFLLSSKYRFQRDLK